MIFNFLLTEIFSKYSFFQVNFLHALLFGLCFSIASRIIYGLLYHGKIYIDSSVFFLWTFAYGLSLWFFEFLRNLFIIRANWIVLSNLYFGALFIGLGLFFAIKIVQKMDFNLAHSRSRFFRAPSQIFTGIILLVAGILCWRFSGLVFLNWFNWPEGMAWSWLIGLGFLIAGFLTLLAWWRNNVLQHRFGLKIGKW